jgi:hypothetical protein
MSKFAATPASSFGKPIREFHGDVRGQFECGLGDRGKAFRGSDSGQDTRQEVTVPVPGGRGCGQGRELLQGKSVGECEVIWDFDALTVTADLDPCGKLKIST